MPIAVGTTAVHWGDKVAEGILGLGSVTEVPGGKDGDAVAKGTRPQPGGQAPQAFTLAVQAACLSLYPLPRRVPVGIELS